MRNLTSVFLIAGVVAILAAAKPLSKVMKADAPAGNAQVVQTVPAPEAPAAPGAPGVPEGHSAHDGHDHGPADPHAADPQAAPADPHAGVSVEQAHGKSAAAKNAPAKMTPEECSAYCTKLMREKGMEGQCPVELCTTDLCPMHERVVTNASDKTAKPGQPKKAGS